MPKNYSRFKLAVIGRNNQKRNKEKLERIIEEILNYEHFN